MFLSWFLANRNVDILMDPNEKEALARMGKLLLLIVFLVIGFWSFSQCTSYTPGSQPFLWR